MRSRVALRLTVMLYAAGPLSAIAGQFPAARPRSESTSAAFEVGSFAARENNIPVHNFVFVPLGDKPEGISKEPTYRATPRYSVVRVGNGPKATYLIAVDEPEAQDFKIYVDLNRNGDLTDDGDGSYDEKTRGIGRRFIRDPGNTTVYTKSLVMRDSWGSKDEETGSGNYGVRFDRVIQRGANVPEVLRSYLRMEGNAAGIGTIALDGVKHKAMLITEAIGAIHPTQARVYCMPGNPESEQSRLIPQYAWIYVDVNGDGALDGKDPMETYNIFLPFQIDGKDYEAAWSPNASHVTLTPTTKTPKDVLLPVGKTAPEFTVEAWGGGRIRLSDYEGKVVVLDFWGTWCPPCLRGLPHLDQVYRAAKDRDVVVLAIATTDTRDRYEDWMAENKGKYALTFAFDDSPGNDIAYSLYQATGMPTTYVIGKDGRVAAAFDGYDDGDTRIHESLKALGVEIEPQGKK